MHIKNDTKIGFCTTTINVPFFLDKFAKNFLKNKHKNIVFYVIGDHKTPAGAESYVKTLNKKYPYDFRYYDVKKIKKIFSKEPTLKKLISFYSGIMKFIAVYLSYKENCEICLQIDDDNFVLEKDYLKEAKKILKKNKLLLVKSKTGWTNVYKFLKEKNNKEFYPRAYPWSKRFFKTKDIKITKNIKPILFNGSVLGDPDIDAITRLNGKIVVTGFNSKIKQYGIYPGTWTSFNNQNTGFVRDLVPAYFTPFSTGRNADIWASYMICKIVEIHQETVLFGKPIVRQIRNPHNYWQDLKDEIQNDYLTDEFVEILKKVKVKKSKSYLNTCEIICKKSLIYLKGIKMNQIDKKYILSFFKEYLQWIKIYKK